MIESKTQSGDRIYQYESLTEYGKLYKDSPIRGSEKSYSGRWIDPDYSADQLVAMARNGGSESVAKSLLGRIGSIQVPDAQEFVPEPALSVVGGAVSVPAYLSGAPACMLTMIERVQEKTPARIFVNLLASAVIKPENLKDRAALFVALIAQLSRIRPVDVVCVAPQDGAGGSATVQIIPLSRQSLIAESGLALGCPGFMRWLALSTCFVLEPKAGKTLPCDKIESRMPRVLAEVAGYDPERDLYIPWWRSVGDIRLGNPQKWIDDQIARIAK